MQYVESRQIKGQQIADNGKIKFERGIHFVPSTTTQGKVYKVNSTTLECNCPDYSFRKEPCKHAYAVASQQGKVDNSNVAEFPKNRYGQKWAIYNKSQTTEKSEFLRLISDLTRDIHEPQQTNGRPALPLGDMVFAIVYKVYSQMSSRRFTTDIEAAHAQGYIDECPHFNSLIRYMDKESLTPILESLIEATAQPLSALETSFAVDSTGMSISNSVSWHRAKHQDKAMLERKNWIKLHCAVGIKTNVISSCKITDKHGHDHSNFIPVMDATRKNFDVKEVMADKAYSSKEHVTYSDLHGISPYIPFKDSVQSYNVDQNPRWSRYYHYFALNRSEFIAKYNMRSNVETTFHMLKSKFGGLLKSRTFNGQRNEALCKVICHNICCLIQAINEFGIEI